MTTDNYVVFIVNDDGGITEAPRELLETYGMRAVAFGSAGEYVTDEKSDVPACLILDVELPEISSDTNYSGRSPSEIIRQSLSSPEMTQAEGH
jgi:FixJ family two-component response regulator